MGDIIAVATLPVLSLLLGQEPAITAQTLAILLLIAAKRLHANRLPLPQDPQERRQVLIRRLLYDRDVPPDAPWTERTGIRSGRPSE